MASDCPFTTETGSLAVLYVLTSWIPLKEAEESFLSCQSIFSYLSHSCLCQIILDEIMNFKNSSCTCRLCMGCFSNRNVLIKIHETADIMSPIENQQG